MTPMSRSQGGAALGQVQGRRADAPSNRGADMKPGGTGGCATGDCSAKGEAKAPKRPGVDATTAIAQWYLHLPYEDQVAVAGRYVLDECLIDQLRQAPIQLRPRAEDSNSWANPSSHAVRSWVRRTYVLEPEQQTEMLRLAASLGATLTPNQTASLL